MVIRTEQMIVFEEHMFMRFVDQMTAHIRLHFPKQTADVPENELRRAVLAATERAETYGVVYETDVRRYLEYVIGYGADFDSAPWAASVLRRSTSGTAKMNDLDDANVCRLSGSSV